MVRLSSIQSLASEKGFEIQPTLTGKDRVRVTCKGAVLRKANGAASWTLEEARRYLRRFPDRERWCG